MHFIGFALLELVKATGKSDVVETARTYDVVIYDKFGNIIKKNMKLNDIERDWCKVRKTDLNHALMIGCDVRLISKEYFEEQLAEWKALVGEAHAKSAS